MKKLLIPLIVVALALIVFFSVKIFNNTEKQGEKETQETTQTTTDPDVTTPEETTAPETTPSDTTDETTVTTEPDKEHVYDNDCDKTCNECGEEREITHKFSTDWSSDSDGHWHVCSVCGEKDEVKAHKPGAEATETTAQVCTECDYVIVNPLGHIHKYKTEWSSDSSKHWHSCSGCDAKKDESAHVYDNACDASCNTCGYVRTIQHNYKSSWSSDAKSHWHECTVCGHKKDTANHIAGNGPTETEPQKCTACGYVIKAALGHTHKYSTDWSKDASSHWHACSGCGEKKDTASHVYDNSCDTSCNTCGYTRTVTHKYADSWERDGSYHWHKCTVCGNTDAKTAHKFDNACDTTCDTCYYTRTVTHNYSTTWNKDSTNHWKTCTICSSVKDKQAHRYDNACDTDCNDCGHNRVTSHSYSTTLKYDDTNHWRVCSVCGEKDTISAHAFDNACDTSCNKCEYTRNASHSFSDKYTSNETAHWYACTKCGYEGSKANHAYTNACDNTCDTCGYERTANHTFTSAWNKDETGHWNSCFVCGASNEVKAHIYENDCDEKCDTCSYEREAEHSFTAAWETDMTFHWHECGICGEKGVLMNHKYSNGCDPTCDTCGYTREAGHDYSDSWSKDASTHWHQCTICGDIIDTRPHTFNNSCDSDCNVCGYVRAVTHPYSSDWSTNGQYHWHACTLCSATTEMIAHKYDNMYDMVCNDCSYTEGIKLSSWLNPSFNKITGGMISNDNGNVYDFRSGFGTSSHAPFSVYKRGKLTGTLTKYTVTTARSTYNQNCTIYGNRSNGVLRVDTTGSLGYIRNFNTFSNPGEIYVLPNSTEDILLCFTAPADGTYIVRASAERAFARYTQNGVNGTGSRFFIEANGVVKAEKIDKADTAPTRVDLTATVTLKKGETVYFGHDPYPSSKLDVTCGMADDFKLHYFIVEKEGTPKSESERTTNKISVQMAKNEKESFQISVSSAKAINGMKLVQTSSSVNNINVEFLQEHNIMVNGIPVPDPIYPIKGSFDVKANETKTLLIRFGTNANTKPGTYTYTFELRTPMGKTIEKYSVTLTVWNFTIPEDTSCETATGVGRDQITAKEGADYYVEYYDLLLDYRMNAYYLPYDILDSRADKYMSDPRVTAFQVWSGASDAKILEYYKKLKTNPEWLEKAYFYPYDEPNTVAALDELAAICKRLRQLAPEIRIVIPFFTNVNYNGTMDSVDFLDQYIDIWCPKSACWSDGFLANPLNKNSFASRMEGMKAKGEKLWWYVCWEPGAPYCNLYLNERSVDHRILFWQQYMTGVNGFLYWNSTYWNFVNNPWESMVTVPGLSANVYGDGSLLYPGKPVGVKGACGSVRLECVRDGIEDFEMFKLAEAKFGKSWVMTQINKVTTSVTSHNYSSDLFAQVRKAVGDALSNAS